MEQGDHIEDRVSVIVDDDEILAAGSDNDDEAHSRPDPFEVFTRNGLVKVGELRNNIEQNVVKSFVLGMGQHAKETEVVALHSNLSIPNLMITRRARLDAFRIYEQAVAKKCGGNANVRFAWYAASREEICQIISHGFSRCNGETAADGVSHGVGVYLYPTTSLTDCVASSVADENGLRHMLLCRVILGKMEVIPAGSKQIQPSSMEFDSGVDNLAAPRRHIVWSAFMNSHIFPLYILSFKAPSINGLNRNRVSAVRQNLQQVSFAAMFSSLLRILCPAKRALLSKCYADFQEHKITRVQALTKVRQITGDDQLLVQIVKSNKEKLMNRDASGSGR